MTDHYRISTHVIPMFSSPLHDGTLNFIWFDPVKAELSFDVQLSCDSNDEIGWFGKLTFYGVAILRSTVPLDSLEWSKIADAEIIDAVYQNQLNVHGKDGMLWAMDLFFRDNHSDQLILEFISDGFTWQPDRHKPYTD